MMDDGVDPEVRILSSAELDKALRMKLVEEAREVVEAATPEAFLEEMADLWEVWYTLIRHHGLLCKDAYEAARDKGMAKGRFAQGFEVETSGIPTPLFGVGVDQNGHDAILLPNRTGGGYVSSDPATRNVGLVTHVRFYPSNGNPITVPLSHTPAVAPGDVFAAKLDLS
jgi:phosphoribosyl-ATP pyrophosphohydrolase